MTEDNAAISIVLLTYNGEVYLTEVLASIFAQKTSFSYEVVAVDSGSTDRTLEILANYPVRVIQIPNRSFGHGRTRNFGAKNVRGRYVVFLTQDATPVGENWLDNLVRPISENQLVAGAYSRQIPRPDCNPVEARDIGIGAGPLSIVKRIDLQDPVQIEHYKAWPFRFIAFSNVSSCIRRDVLESIPFSETIVMMEDQEWCKRVIESGYWVIYEASSVVYHSHNHSLKGIYKRHFDYGVSLREFAPLPTMLKSVLLYTIFEAMGDVIFVFGQGLGTVSGFKWMLKAPVVRFAMRYGLYRGLHNTIEAPQVNAPQILTDQSHSND
jgi:GT2 family glycosyltransferase